MNSKSASNVRKISKYIFNRRPLPKKRVFYIGYRYVGTMFCEEIQDIFLKREGKVNGNQKWSFITYPKCEENGRYYSFQIDECFQDEVPKLIELLELEKVVTLRELRDMGWRESAKVFKFAKKSLT